MKIALLAEEGAGARALQMLASGSHDICALLTSPGSPVWRLAGRLGVAALPASRVRDPQLACELAGIELLLNVHSLHIVPPALLAAPRLGAYNLHPGPLPDYAGLNAPSWAIYHGEASHGVTLHRMEPGIDTGPIVYQERFAVGVDETALGLALRCVETGLRLLARLLATLADNPGTLPVVPQDLSRRRYFGRGAPQEGRVSWDAPAHRIHAFVRACDYHPFPSPWGTPRARLDGTEVELAKVALTGEPSDAPPGTVRESSDETFVACADEWLRLRRYSPAGKLAACPIPPSICAPTP
jgi:methionyl-tRNA formyltransferase